MKVKKVVLSWIKKDIDPVDYQNINRLDIIFQENVGRPILCIDAGSLKIEDSGLPIDSKEVLSKIGDIDFESISDFRTPNEFIGDKWELTINDKVYEGVMEEPIHVSKIKKIIRFNAIQLYANKKVASYIKG